VLAAVLIFQGVQEAASRAFDGGRVVVMLERLSSIVFTHDAAVAALQSVALSAQTPWKTAESAVHVHLRFTLATLAQIADIQEVLAPVLRGDTLDVILLLLSSNSGSAQPAPGPSDLPRKRAKTDGSTAAAARQPSIPSGVPLQEALWTATCPRSTADRRPTTTSPSSRGCCGGSVVTRRGAVLQRAGEHVQHRVAMSSWCCAVRHLRRSFLFVLYLKPDRISCSSIRCSLLALCWRPAQTSCRRPGTCT